MVCSADNAILKKVVDGESALYGPWKEKIEDFERMGFVDGERGDLSYRNIAGQFIVLVRRGTASEEKEAAYATIGEGFRLLLEALFESRDGHILHEFLGGCHICMEKALFEEGNGVVDSTDGGGKRLKVYNEVMDPEEIEEFAKEVVLAAAHIKAQLFPEDKRVARYQIDLNEVKNELLSLFIKYLVMAVDRHAPEVSRAFWSTVEGYVMPSFVAFVFEEKLGQLESGVCISDDNLTRSRT